MTRVLIFGGRDFTNRSAMFRALDQLDSEINITVVIHGEATGADTLGDQWAVARKKKVKSKAAKWDDLTAPGAVIRVNRAGKQYNVLAGFQRNKKLRDKFKPQLGIEWPGGNGTADMAKLLTESGIPVRAFNNRGEEVCTKPSSHPKRKKQSKNRKRSKAAQDSSMMEVNHSRLF